MVGLEDLRAPLAQLLHLGVECAGDDADEAGNDDEATDGDDEHQQAEQPALVTAHGAGIEGAHEATPEDVPRREIFTELVVLVGQQRHDKNGDATHH